MVHQKGHKKSAGEAGGKARFERWQEAAPAEGPCLRARGGAAALPARSGVQIALAQCARMLRARRRSADARSQNAIDRLGFCSPYVPYQETRHGTH